MPIHRSSVTKHLPTAKPSNMDQALCMVCQLRASKSPVLSIKGVRQPRQVRSTPFFPFSGIYLQGARYTTYASASASSKTIDDMVLNAGKSFPHYFFPSWLYTFRELDTLPMPLPLPHLTIDDVVLNAGKSSPHYFFSSWVYTFIELDTLPMPLPLPHLTMT